MVIQAEQGQDTFIDIAGLGRYDAGLVHGEIQNNARDHKYTAHSRERSEVSPACTYDMFSRGNR
jgi:hypothetical protein